LLQVIARLKPGIPLEQARTELDTIRQRLEEENWQRPAVESKNSAPVNLSASRSAPALSDVQAAAVPETTFSLPADGTKIRRAFPRRAKGKPTVSSRESGDNQVEIRSTRSLPRQRQEQRFFAVDKSVSGPPDTFTDQSGPQLGSPSRLLSSGG